MPKRRPISNEVAINDLMTKRSTGLFVGRNQHQVTLQRFVDGEIVFREVWLPAEARRIAKEILDEIRKLEP